MSQSAAREEFEKIAVKRGYSIETGREGWYLYAETADGYRMWKAAWSSALERAAQLAEGYAYTRSFEPDDLAAAIRALAEAE